MIYSKNNLLLFRYMLGLMLLLATIPAYAQDTIVNDSSVQEQSEISVVESQPTNAEGVVKKVTYKESTVKQYNKLCQTADALMEKSSYDKAIESLNKAIKLCPETDKAYALKSICLRLTNKTSEAKENAQKAYQINPNNYIANEEMGIICSLEGNYKKALFFLDKAESLNKNYERTYANRGFTYYLMDDYEKSITDFNTAIRINPNSLFPHEYRAYAYLELDGKKNAPLALKDAAFLIQKDPKNMAWYRLRAICYANMNNVPMALADINKAVKNDPENFQSYLDRLKVYRLINASDDLVTKDIQSAEQYAGNDSTKILAIVKNAKGKNNNSFAEKLLDKVLKIDPTNTDALFQKAQIQIEEKDYSTALDSINKIEELNPIHDFTAWFYLTKALAEFGVAGLDNKQLIRNGISDINKVIEKNEHLNFAYSFRGAANVALGEYQLGLNDFQKAKDLGENYKDSLYWIGLANFKLGKTDVENVYLDIIESYCNKSYNLEEMALGQHWQDGFDNASFRDTAAKVNVLSFYSIKDNLFKSNSLMSLISDVESSYVSIERAYEQNGKIITLPYKNVNGDIGNNLSQQMKDKIVINLSQRALIEAVGNSDVEVNNALDKLLEVASTKQKIDTLLTVVGVNNTSTVIDFIDYDNTRALNKIVENISIYDTSVKADQDKIKKILRKAYAKLAVAEEDENGIESAMDYYNRAMYYGYPKFDVYSTYAYYYFNKEDYFQASKWATSALKAKADANLYALRGDAKAELNDYDGAIYDYTKALGYNSKLYSAYFARGQIYFSQKKWAMAQADFIKYASFNKNEGAAPFNIATCLQNQGKKQAALPWYEKAKAIYQENGDQSGYNDCVRRINEIKGYNRSWW